MSRDRTMRRGTPVLWRALVPLLLLLFAGAAHAARDPGPRAGAPGAGGPLPALTDDEAAFFDLGLDEFTEVGSVQGEAVIPGTEAGLGPRFNALGCAVCHSHPAIGGTSPPINPQVANATAHGARNRVPWFVAARGPVREARFVARPDGSPDGGVASLFVITGRVDAGGCNIAQPDFGPPGNPITGQGGSTNLIFRIPTPTFGLGLVEAIPDSAILANRAANLARKASLGISGRVNRTGNDGSITRFGWKAQNKSLLLFSAEAYNVEQGITNEIFGDERDQTPGCALNPLPEDETGLAADGDEVPHSGITLFAKFMRFLAPPQPLPPTRTTEAGRAAFDRVGCTMCHTPTLRTGRAASEALSNKPVNLYSDLLLHDMGTELADRVSQGLAQGDEFRTAPLWGLGQRLFLLHDGRTTDLVEAIEAHASPGSEANGSVQRYRALADWEQQALLEFLRSL
jgi:CxxC motif-containing protein (DUF1111 family)